MGKKRVDRTSFSCLNRKAQVTIFIILGLVIFFVFIMMVTTVSKVKKGQLEMEKEGVFDQIFKKEAMRIYVEDCLNDELEKGLVLLGTQGRFWQGQPGGIKPFIPKETGLNYGGERIFYGIAKQKYPIDSENAYPCKNDENSPEFCQYSFPDLSLNFGQLQLLESTIGEDLGRYLANRTVWCVENYTKTNISSKAKIESTEMVMEVKILEDGISVKADYPLKFSLGNQEFFQLTTFDFFYSSKFKPFLRAAITYPLDYDRKYLDFNYTQEMLERDSFNYSSDKKISESCQDDDHYLCTKMNPYFESYQSLNIQLSMDNSQGDDIFTFKTDKVGEIIHDSTYSFRIARQNRPPALDYVGRFACPSGGYDYLVIQDDLELGNIEINLSAKDPDEDKVSYGFESGDLPGLTLKENKLNAPVPNSLGIYNFIAKAFESDNPSSLDWQKVRVLVDRPLKTNFWIDLPYVLPDGEYKNKYPPEGNLFLVSREDPVFLYLQLPDPSETDPETTTILKYDNANNDPLENDGFEKEIPGDLSITDPQGVVRFPDLEIGAKDLNDLDSDNIKSLNEKYFQYLTNNGKLSLTFAATYCDKDKKESSKEATVAVVQCLPHRNPSHPYASPYDQYTFEIDSDGKTDLTKQLPDDELESPYLATHNCCYDTGEVKPVSEECFVNPKLGCYNGIQGLTNDKKGFLLEEEFANCDGIRGNICNENTNYRLKGGQMVCGNSDGKNCKAGLFGDIPSQCRGQDAYGYVDTDGNGDPDGWCHGTLGCDDFCDKTEGDIISADPNLLPKTENHDFNQIAEDEYKKDKVVPSFASDYKLDCKCKVGNVCDADFDGKFNGKCQGGGSTAASCCNPIGSPFTEIGIDECVPGLSA